MSNYQSKWERVEDEDPNRCQYIIPTTGQCNLKAVEGSEYCPAHGGNKAYQAKEAQSLKNYRLSKFKVRTQELGNSDAILSLKDEIGILRLLIEERINRCDSNHDLIMMSGPLSDLITKVEKLVTSCNRLESKLGNLLDRTKVLQFAQTIVQIVSKHVEADALETISDEILKEIK